MANLKMQYSTYLDAARFKMSYMKTLSVR